MKLRIDDNKQRLYGEETVTFYNNSPDALNYLWMELTQNVRALDSDSYKIQSTGDLSAQRGNEKMVIGSTVSSRTLENFYRDFDGGFKIQYVKDEKNKNVPYTINKTMMRIDVPEPIQPGETYTFKIKWWYNINDHIRDGGRSGYEHFEEDDNYIYTIAQFFPRMCMYNDVYGWQNKQFLGRGEFTLIFGDYDVKITVPEDFVVGATGSLQNPDEVLSEEQIKNAKISQQKNVDAYRISAEKETRLLDIEKAKRLKLEEHQKELEIIDKSKAVLKSKAEEEATRAKAVEAEEKANSTRYIERAQGIKQVDVISAASKAEQDKHETLAAKLRYEIDAAGKKALNAAENLRSDASRRSALRLKLADKIESIIRESVKPMANIGDIKIVDVNGLPGFSGGNPDGGNAVGSSGGKGDSTGRSGNLADSVVNSALRYRAHQPFLDSLLKEIGMNPGEISNIRNILGDYDNPKKDFHMNFDKDPTKSVPSRKNPKK